MVNNQKLFFFSCPSVSFGSLCLYNFLYYFFVFTQSLLFCEQRYRCATTRTHDECVLVSLLIFLIYIHQTFNIDFLFFLAFYAALCCSASMFCFCLLNFNANKTNAYVSIVRMVINSWKWIFYHRKRRNCVGKIYVK